MIETKIISGFPGVGKSYLVNRREGSDYAPQGFYLDSDSSRFDKEDFPNNYIEDIKSNIGKASVIFVSSHKEVRQALVDNDIDFILAYPHKSLKIEYIQRYIERGSPSAFIELMFKNWESWIDECFNQEGCKHLILNSGEYLYDVCKY